MPKRCRWDACAPSVPARTPSSPLMRVALCIALAFATVGTRTAAGPPGAPARDLFSGRDLTGWKTLGNADWKVVDGVLVGSQGPRNSGGDLISEETFDDFELVVTYRISWPANSGVWFRYQSPQSAYQADILEWKDPVCWTGSIYRPGRMFIALNTDETTVRRDGWNTLRILARDSRLAVDLNGVRVAEVRDEGVRSGSIGFQVHGGSEFASMKLEVRTARIRSLKGVSEDRLVLQEAAARIERHRKGPLLVRVVDSKGRPVAGADVSVRQKGHEFLFGCNLYMFGRLGSSRDEERYRSRFASLFNFATLPFYWRAYERRQGHPDHARCLAMARWCREQGITTKGHPLVWNHPASVPDWLSGESTAIRALSEARVEDCVEHFKGWIGIWDVVNEATDPLRFDDRNAMTDAMRDLGVVDWTRRSFLAARRAQPDAFLLINDYRVDDAYEKLITELVQDGRPLYDGIGIQSHMHGGVWPPAKVWSVCERFARFGVPLHFTETTIVSGRRESRRRWGPSEPEHEEAQARAVREFYTSVFGHPAVKALTWWDFADRGAWQGAPAGFLRRDLSPKPAYDRLHDLLRRRWWTDVTVQSDDRGEARVRAFFGTHEIEVRSGRQRAVLEAGHAARDGHTTVRLSLE